MSEPFPRAFGQTLYSSAQLALNPVARTHGDVRHLLRRNPLHDGGGAVVGCTAELLHQARPRVQAPPLLRHGHHRQPRRKVTCRQSPSQV